MEFEQIPCNVIDSPTDYRDWIYTSKEDIPLSLDYRPQLCPIRNQGKVGSCFAMSSCCMKEFQERKDYNFQDYFSPKFFYSQRQNIRDDNLHNDEGMFSRDVMKLLKNTGVCYESSCPYTKVEEPFKYGPLFEEAKKHTIRSYARVKDRSSLCRALVDNGICLITFPVYHKGPEMWNPLHKGDVKQGGHAMAVVGYDMVKQHFIIRNSWGTSFGDKGYCYFKFEDWGKHREVWTTVDNESHIRRRRDPILPFKIRKVKQNCCTIL